MGSTPIISTIAGGLPEKEPAGFYARAAAGAAAHRPEGVKTGTDGGEEAANSY